MPVLTEGASKQQAFDAEDTMEEAIADESAPATDAAEDAEAPDDNGSPGMRWKGLLAFGILPGVALLLALACGYLKYQDASVREGEAARAASVRAAADSTIALLSYKPDTVEKDLGAARDRITGDFRDAYTSLTHDVVIPGAKQQQISAVATVPAAAPVSASENHAVVLVFVNQTITVGHDAPTDTASRVKVTLDKINGQWLISRFEPI